MKKINPKSTVLVITTGFIIIYFFTSWVIILIAAIVTGVLGFSDRMSHLIHTAWMGLAKLLSYIIPNILLTLIFYLILFPLALLSRLKNKDPLMMSSTHSSYWNKDEQTPSKESFEKTW